MPEATSATVSNVAVVAPGAYQRAAYTKRRFWVRMGCQPIFCLSVVGESGAWQEANSNRQISKTMRIVRQGREILTTHILLMMGGCKPPLQPPYNSVPLRNSVATEK